jgi:hypothetical protein
LQCQRRKMCQVRRGGYAPIYHPHFIRNNLALDLLTRGCYAPIYHPHFIRNNLALDNINKNNVNNISKNMARPKTCNLGW